MNLLLVGSGGFLGAVLRYLVGGWAQRLSQGASFPYGTLVVNATGGLVLGLLVGQALARLGGVA